jgi:hypothetical protein
MKKVLIACITATMSTLCVAQSAYINAVPMDQRGGTPCKVFVSDLRPGSEAMYLGTCGWMGLKGIASYTIGWNHGNHIRVVRGQFDSGKPVFSTKVTYFNKVEGTITTYIQSDYGRSSFKKYQLDDVLVDAKQVGLRLDDSIMAYTKIANYLDVFE